MEIQHNVTMQALLVFEQTEPVELNSRLGPGAAGLPKLFNDGGEIPQNHQVGRYRASGAGMASCGQPDKDFETPMGGGAPVAHSGR